MATKDPAFDPRLDNRLKQVEGKLDYPPLTPELRKFIDWVADYTLTARGTVLRMCLRMGTRLGPERVRIGVRLRGATAGADDRGTPTRSRPAP